MKSFFFLDSDTGATKATWTLPRDQTKFENCTLHNYNVVPTKKRDVLVQGSYQSGLGILDFTDLNRIREVAFADPIPPERDGESERHADPPGRRLVDPLVQRNRLPVGHLARLPFVAATEDTFRGATNLSRLNPQTQEFTVSKGAGTMTMTTTTIAAAEAVATTTTTIE